MKRRWIIALSVLLIAALAAGAVFGLRAVRASKPVVLCGEYELTNTELAYYYWSEYFYFAEAYGEYLEGMVDFSRPLSEQTYEGNLTWEDYLLEETLATIRDTLAMVIHADETGHSMAQDYQTTYQEVLVNFAAAAQEGGYRDLDAYLKASYGDHAARESFERYLYHSHLAASCADQLYADCRPDDDTCRDYFSSHQAYYEEYYDAIADDETTWMEAVRQDVQTEEYQNAFLGCTAQCQLLVDYDAIRLEAPDTLYEQ